MSSRSRSDSQLGFGPLPLADRKQDEAPLPKCTQRAEAQEVWGELFDEALTNARVSTSEVAFILDISESLVRRMRSKDARESVSGPQLLMMPPAVQFRFIQAWFKRQRFGQTVIAQVLDSIGLLSLSVER